MDEQKFDYNALLDAKTKRRLLMDSIEGLNNDVKYYVEERCPEESVEILEKLQTVLALFVEENIK